MTPDADRPHVLLVGGYLTEPLYYRRVARRLLAHGAAAVSEAPVHVPDWLAAAVVGFGPLLEKTGRAIREAQARAGGRPIILVGHSAGGILARLALLPVPFEGRCADASEAVGCLVTLGTPHALASASVRFQHRGVEAARFLERTTPGAWFVPRTAYLTIGSDLVRPGHSRDGRAWDRLRGSLIRSILGPLPEAGGDGIVAADAAHLPGARHVTFPDVRHGHIDGPWYGDAEIIGRWWPLAVELWRAAVAGREAAGPGTGPAGAIVPAGVSDGLGDLVSGRPR